jgi:hypothetical protein
VDAPLRVVNPTTSDSSPNTGTADLFGKAGGEASSGAIPKARGNRARPESLIQTIQSAALHPEVDPVKFDRLLMAQDRIAAKQARIAFDDAFSRMQAELPIIAERGTITDGFGLPGSSYARWEDINEAIKPILAKHGFGLRFRTGQDHGTIVITAIVSHALGHSEETTMRLPVDLSGGKNPVQAIGSSTSYGKRYTASALLNLTSRGEDDDGRAAAPPPKITAEELAELRKLMARSRADERRLAAYLGVTTLEDLPPTSLERAREAVQFKGGRQ